MSTVEPVALNQGVARYVAHRDAHNLIEYWYEPSGKLRVPVLILHNLRDPVVPVHPASTYSTIAAASGASDMVAVQVLDQFGHGASVAQQLQAFQDLVTWVTTGVQP